MRQFLSFLLSIERESYRIEENRSFPRSKGKKKRVEIFRCLIRIMRKVFEIFDRQFL